MSDVDLAGLEQRVTEKLLAALPKLDLPDDLPPLDFSRVSSLATDWPQYPRAQWIVWPVRRAVALTLADRLIDFGRLSEASFLIEHGGKERIS